MGSSPDDIVAIAGEKSSFSALRCHMCDGSKDDAGECDGIVCEFGGCSSCCGEFGCECITFESDSDVSSDDVILPDFGSSDLFGLIMPLVLELGFVHEELEKMFFVGRAWSVRQPSAEKAVRGVLAATEIKTSLRRVDELPALVPLALGWIRQGCPDDEMQILFPVQARRSQENKRDALRCRVFSGWRL